FLDNFISEKKQGKNRQGNIRILYEYRKERRTVLEGRVRGCAGTNFSNVCPEDEEEGFLFLRRIAAWDGSVLKYSGGSSDRGTKKTWLLDDEELGSCDDSLESSK